MKKSTSILLMIASGLVIMGLLLCGIMFFISGGNLGVYYNSSGFHYAYENGKNSGAIISEQQEFTGITELDINVDVATMQLRTGSAGSGVTIEYSYPASWPKPVCTSSGGQLYFSFTANKRISFVNTPKFNNNAKVIITYPEGMEFRAVHLSNNLGAVSVEQLKVSGKLTADVDLGAASFSDISAEELSVTNSGGTADLSNVTAQTIAVESTLGAINCDNITAEKFSADNNTGAINISGSKLGHANIHSDLGQIDLSQVATTALEVKSAGGGVTLEGELAGKSEVSSDLGSIKITTSIPRDQYSFDLSTDLGQILIDGQKQSGRVEQIDTTVPNLIEVQNSGGKITIQCGNSPSNEAMTK